MKKLLAVGILAAIPIGIVVLLVVGGGWGALLFFVGMMIALTVVALVAVWAVQVIFG